jgi:CRP-like cAMP-binding protein
VTEAFASLQPVQDVGTAHRLRLIRKLESIAKISPEERQAVLALPLRVREYGDAADIVREGESPPDSCLLLEGFLCRYKMSAGGRRQILSFHIPGDIPDLQSLFLDVMDHSLGTLAPSRVAFIPHVTIHAMLRDFPNLAAVFWRETLIDAAIFREWLTSAGRRTAHQRVAHVLCEVYVRLRAVGLHDGAGFNMPATQAELSDALGLSAVHVNRVLQDLRRSGLIRSHGKRIEIVDWPRLQQAGAFDPTYLHLHQGRPDV